MKTMAQNPIFRSIMGVWVASLALHTEANAQYYPAKTNHFAQSSPAYPSPLGVNTGVMYGYPPMNMVNSPMNMVNSPMNVNRIYPQNLQHISAHHSVPSAQYGLQYGPQQGMPRPVNRGYNHRRYKRPGLFSWLSGRKPLARQIPAPHPGPQNMFQRWVEYEPQYKFYPGDQLDIVVATAPELSRTLTIGPDGRVSMPLVEPIMAAGRPLQHIQNSMRAELAKQLVDPAVTVTPRAFAPAQVYVGGEVNAQGTYTLPGPLGALEAIIMAGGMNASAKSSNIAVLRRAPNGGMMMRTVNIRNGMRNIREYNDNMQLRRGDIVFVPRTTLAEVGVFVQALRAALPVDVNVSYNIGNNGGGTDPSITNNGTGTTITP